MLQERFDTPFNTIFPAWALDRTDDLVSIASWRDLHAETEVTGVEIDQFWCESIDDGVAYFFKWLGEPRATVLAVAGEQSLTFVECRQSWDKPVGQLAATEVVSTVVKAFGRAGFSVEPFRDGSA